MQKTRRVRSGGFCILMGGVLAALRQGLGSNAASSSSLEPSTNFRLTTEAGTSGNTGHHLCR
jgi:hypothetical protein